MSNPRYPEKFKIEAVKQVTAERDILKKAAAYFAKACG